MFTTIEQVKEITGYDVTNDVLLLAQAIVETMVGKDETEVVLAKDFRLLAKATAFQAAYMRDNYEKVYEQVAFINKTYSDGSLTLDRSLFAPYVAPLAAMAMMRCSWSKPRSVKTGPVYDIGPAESRWATE